MITKEDKFAIWSFFIVVTFALSFLTEGVSMNDWNIDSVWGVVEAVAVVISLSYLYIVYPILLIFNRRKDE